MFGLFLVRDPEEIPNGEAKKNLLCIYPDPKIIFNPKKINAAPSTATIKLLKFCFRTLFYDKGCPCSVPRGSIIH